MVGSRWKLLARLYFKAALVMALLGFVATAALAKFLMRGEVIE